MNLKSPEEKKDPWYYEIAVVSPIENPIPADKMLLELTQAFSGPERRYSKLIEWSMEVLVTYPELLEPRLFAIEAFLKNYMMLPPKKDLETENINLIPRDYAFQLYSLFKLNAFVKLIDEGLNFFSENLPLLNFKGLMLFYLAKYKEASESFQKVLKKNPKHFEASLNQALCLQKLKQHDSAVNFYNKLNADFPSNSEIKLRQGDLYLKLFSFEKAIECFEEVKKINGETADAYGPLGLIALLQKDFSRARLSFDKAILQDEANWRANLYFGDFLVYQKRYPDAILRYTTITNKLKMYDFLYYRVDNANDEKGTPLIGNEDDLAFHGEVNKSDLQYLIWDVIANLREGRYNAVLQCLLKLKEKRPESPEVRLFMAKCYVYSNNKSAALQELNNGLSLLKEAQAKVSSSSENLRKYKLELFDKRAEVFSLLIDFINIDFDSSFVQALNKRNSILELLFRLYKTKFLLKYYYLPEDDVFRQSLQEAKDKAAEFKGMLEDPNSPLYLPAFLQGNPMLLKFYNNLFWALNGFSKLSDRKAENDLLNGKGEGEGLLMVSNNLELFMKHFPLSSKLRPSKINTDLLNLQKLGKSQAERNQLIKEICLQTTKNNNAAVSFVSANKEIELFVSQGFIGRFYEYFSFETKNCLADQIGQLARIQAIKILIIICQILYKAEIQLDVQKRANEISELAKIGFTDCEPQKKSCCVIF